VTELTDYDVVEMRSVDDEAGFFAVMGFFFASAAVRRDCGGYPLCYGPRYRWFVARRKGQSHVLAFISVEQQGDIVYIRHGYVRPEARGAGLFRSLRQKVLDHIDRLHLESATRQLETSARQLEPYGFEIHSHRGRWVTMVRKANAGGDELGATGGTAVPRNR
jgi:predicted GNAT family acetyltransferase